MLEENALPSGYFLLFDLEAEYAGWFYWWVDGGWMVGRYNAAGEATLWPQV